MKKIKFSICIIIIALSFNIMAVKNKLGKGQIIVKVSTMGLGIEYTHPIKHTLSVGLGVNKFSRSQSLEESDIDYKGDVSFKSFSVIANYHPWKNGFRLRAGAYYNNNEITLLAKSSVTEDITVGDTKFTGADITLNGQLSFKKFAPYIGIGYGSEPIGDNNISFDFDIGIMRSPVQAKLAGSCSVSGVANAGICNTEDFNIKLAQEQLELTDSVNSFDVYPVISIGLSYRF